VGITSKFRKCKELIRKTDLNMMLSLFLAFLMGRTVLGDALTPFGPAVYAGFRASKMKWSLYTGIAVIAGAATLGQWEHVFFQAVCAAVISVMIKTGRKQKYIEILDPIICGCIVFACRSAIATLFEPDLLLYISAFLEGLCAWIVCMLVVSVFRDHDSGKTPAAGANYQAGLALALLSLGGLSGLSFLGMHLQVLVVMCMTLIAGYLGGPSLGAIAGLAGGLVTCLGGTGEPLMIGLLGVAGLMAGVGGWFGRVESCIGFLSSGLIMTYFMKNGLGGFPNETGLLEQMISCGTMFAMTPSLTQKARQRFSFESWSKPERPARAQIEPYKIRAAAVAHALLEMSSLFSEVTVSSTSEKEEVLYYDIKHLNERVCLNCVQRSYCWEENFGDTFDSVSDLIRQMQVTGRLGAKANGLGLDDRCHRFGEIVSELNHQKEIERLEKRLEATDNETKECLAFQYRCLGQLLSDSRTNPGAVKTRGNPDFVQRIKVSLKGITLAADGSSKPGDMWVRYDLDHGKTLVVLVDGMGKGEVAAKQSKETLEILKSLINCGLDYDSCVSFLNSALFLAWRPDGFVALDCLLIDRVKERVMFHKLGAPPSFIKRQNGNVSVVRGAKPPAGALKDLLCFGTVETVSPGDLIFLVSDGIFRSGLVPSRSEQILMARLSRLKGGSLESQVKAIMGHGVRRKGYTPLDDITVVGIRIDSK
jgi:hypothetical protein